MLQLPFRIFPRSVFCFFARIGIRSIYLPFVQIPMYLKKNSKNFAVKKVGEGYGGGGGLQQPSPRPEREGVAAKINKVS